MAKKFLTPIDMNNLEIKNVRAENLSSDPASGTEGRIIYNSVNGTKQLKYWNGTTWVPLTANTDTHYASGTITAASATATSQATAALSNGGVYLNHIENGVVKNSHKISGSGGTTVTEAANSTELVITSPSAYTSNPANIGTTASVGSAANFSRGDHVHKIELATGTSAGQVKIAGTDVSVNGWANKANLASPAFTGTPTAPTASAGTNDTQIATTAFVMNAFAANDAMIFKDGIAGGTSSPGTFTAAAERGHTYRVTTGGYINGVSVEAGDMFICTVDSTAAATSSNYSNIQKNWAIVQNNIDGAVTASVTTANGCLAKFTGDKIVANGPQLGSSTTTFLRNDGSWATPVGSVTGVKGNSETSYRTGQVNLTAANVGAAASSHTHGNIQNGGTLQTNDIAIASGDKLVVTDSSDSSKIARTSLAFDGSTVTKYLSQKGTWEKPSIPVATSTEYGGIKTGFTTSNADRQYAVQLSDGDQAYVTVPTATTSIPGLMSATDKSTLNTLSAHTLATTTLTIAQNGTQTSSTPTTLPGRMVSYIAIMDGEAVEVDAAITFGDPNDSVKFTTGTAAPSAITIRVWYC